MYKVFIDRDKCTNCGFCTSTFKCPSPNECIGCLACVDTCPYQAREAVEIMEKPNYIKIYVDNAKYEVPDNITILHALSSIGININAPCKIGGCWSCTVIVDGEQVRSCITPVESEMRISLDTAEYPPLRIVHGPQGHYVGGKGTPWWEINGINYVEVAIWVSGCNLRCQQCQNYHVTYDNTTEPLTPWEAARRATNYRIIYGTKGIAISGGEPTINRRWLIEYFKELDKLNPPNIRRHLDSNGTMLTPDYIDDLVEAGCNNIGIEPKTFHLDNYMKVTGIKDRDLAKRYHETSWSAIKYIVDNYLDNIYLGVGLVYNSKLTTLDDIAKAGERLSQIDPNIQVTVLDYFPAFRRRDLRRPSPKEMLKVKEILEATGLKYVIVQTSIGHIGPRNRKVYY